MNLDLVIGQIKALAPMFAGNVAGAAAYANGIDNQVWLPMPAAYVVPTDFDAEPNDDANALFQKLTQRFQVIVTFDNSADRRGQTVTGLYQSTQAALFGALLNWRPDSSADNPGLVDPNDPQANRSAKGLYSGGGGLVEFDRARLFYQWSFCLDTAISDADGWQPASAPLTDITMVIPAAPGTVPGRPEIDVDVPLGQPGELDGFQLDVDQLS